LGVDVGPKAFRSQNIIDKLTSAGFAVQDDGDVPVVSRDQLQTGDPKLRYLDEIVRVNQDLARRAHEAIAAGSKVVALGGDHSINLGVFSGASQALNGDLGLIYLDAHGDMNTPDTTMTGNIHGMHLAALMGFGPDELVHVYSEGTKLQKQNLLHIGGNDLDQAEVDLIAQENLTAFTMLDLLSQGMAPLLRHINNLAQRVPNIWVSLDLDSIDEIYAPAAGMPNRGGLSYREVTAIAEYVGKTCNVVGIDVVEYNPLQDIDHKTAELGIELIANFLGKNYSWYTNYLTANQIK
jgi:arginase